MNKEKDTNVTQNPILHGAQPMELHDLLYGHSKFRIQNEFMLPFMIM